ncbi:MAG: hypothetical protein Q9209_006007 [Squamulea sp. 1 TL-2023]
MQKAQTTLQYIAPAIILLYYLATISFSSCMLQTRRKDKRDRPRNITIWCVQLISITYLIQCGDLLIDSLSAIPSISTLAANINAASSTLFWYFQSIVLNKTRRPVLYPYLGTCILTLVFDAAHCSLFIGRHSVRKAVDFVFLANQIGRLTVLLLYLAAHAKASLGSKSLHPDEESASLLQHHGLSAENQEGSAKIPGNYGSAVVADTSCSKSTDSEDSDDDGPSDEAAKKRNQLVRECLRRDGNWLTYLRGFSLFWPMLWPTRCPRLYMNIVGCIVCVLFNRVFRVLQPRQLGIIVNILTSGSGSPYTGIGLYIFYYWFSAVLVTVKHCLWLPMEQYAETQISTAAYNRIMDFSSEFHDNKQSGELYRTISQGDCISDLLDTICWRVGPMLLDLVVGYGYLYYLFGPYMALLAAATTLAYLSSAVQLNSKQSRPRRKYLELGRKECQAMYDSVGSWDTVSYFNRIPYEKKRYADAVSLTMNAQRLYYLVVHVFDEISSSAVTFGFCGALFLAAYQVIHGVQTVGSFVTLLTYWSIFSAPLEQFALIHKQVLRNLVDAEQLLGIFRHEPKIKDGTAKFIMSEGIVEFRSISFSYDGSKQIIKGVSFLAQPGQKIALVGETGGGKSTLLKLIFRFYDVTAGAVLIDGQDVRDVTIASLRGCIGVVPQIPSMFNDTIMNNVRYSKLEATDEEVVEACKAAVIHEKILSFTDGYQSKVGERGVKLSGGELQRLAIARAMLKDPAIILLDEATSSVDTETESRIQSALQRLTTGRTTFTVAHRLSTIMDADVVLVIKDGRVVEQGPPDVLIAAKKDYYNLWCKQTGNSSTMVEAKGNATKENTHTRLESEQAQPGLSEYGKTFRPDAPEFVPSYLKGSASSTAPGDEPGSNTHADVKAGSSQQRQHKTDIAINREAQNQGKGQQDHTNEDECVRGNSKNGIVGRDTVNASGGTKTVSNGLVNTQKRSNFSRVRRRKMSKSETGDSSVTIAGDHFETSHTTLGGSGEGSAAQNRRVSAPSASTVNGKTPGQLRQNSHRWGRKRNQNSSNTQSAPGTWSGLPPPSEPVPTSGGSGEGESKGNVRFAQNS